VRLGFATYLSPNALPFYEFVTREVGKRLGVQTSLIVGDDYERCERDVDDVCFVCSLPYVTFVRRGTVGVEPLAAPVLLGDRYGGRPVYFSDVIVRRDSDVASFEHLRGRSWSYNEPLSHSGYGITRYHLFRMGETEGFFGEVVEAGFHLESIRLVREGKVDASAIDSQVLDIELRDDPALADDIRVITSLGPSTIQPVVASKRLSPELRDDLRAALVALGNDVRARDGLALGLVERFVPVDDGSYADIRDMLAATEAAGFTELR
jgi:phosphonate transport system substrate-binding protein